MGKVWIITGAGRGMGLDIAKQPWLQSIRLLPPAETPKRWHKPYFGKYGV